MHSWDHAGAPTFQQLLGRVKASANSAMAHSTVPFACVISEVGVPASTDHAPVFQTVVQVATALPSEVLGVAASAVTVLPQRHLSMGLIR